MNFPNDKASPRSIAVGCFLMIVVAVSTVAGGWAVLNWIFS